LNGGRRRGFVLVILQTFAGLGGEGAADPRGVRLDDVAGVA
jgi:hypothetical protein